MLKQIFDSITPDNIKDLDIIRDAMDIFIENLENNSEISTDITKLFTSENEEIQNALYATYIQSLYDAITSAQTNPLIAAKLENHLAEYIPIQGKITDILNDEYLLANKVIKQKTGLASIIEHTYNLAKYLQDNEKNSSDFEFNEVKPFHFNVKGSIYREVYDNFVKPLSHPIGFTHDYLQTLIQPLFDYFQLDTEYKFNNVEIRCLSGYFYIFTPDADDTNVKIDILSRTNYATGELYTLNEYINYFTVLTNKEPIDFINYEDGSRVVKFSDDTIVKQTLDPIKVYYRNLSDEQAENDVYIQEFNTQCSLYVDAELIVSTQYDDDIVFSTENFFEEEYDVSEGGSMSVSSDEERIVWSGYYFYSSDNKYFNTADNWYFYSSDTV